MSKSVCVKLTVYYLVNVKASCPSKPPQDIEGVLLEKNTLQLFSSFISANTKHKIRVLPIAFTTISYIVISRNRDI
jgi:hypothetical protein